MPRRGRPPKNSPRYAKASDIAIEKKLDTLDNPSVRDESRILRILKANRDEAWENPAKRLFDEQFTDAQDMVRGDQWPGDRFDEAPLWRWRVTRNMSFPATRGIADLMLDAVPDYHLIPDTPDLYDQQMKQLRQSGQLDQLLAMGLRLPTEGVTKKDYLNALTDLMKANDDFLEQDLRLSLFVDDCTIGGLAVAKVTFSEKLNAPYVYQADPRDFAFDAACTDRLAEDAKLMFLRKRMTMDEIRRQHPQLSKTQLRAIFETGKVHQEDRRYEYYARQRERFHSAWDLFPDKSLDTDDEFKEASYDVWEAWYLGKSFFELESFGQDGMNFPQGRVFVWCGEVLIYPSNAWDGANPYGDGTVPFVLFRNYGDARDPYGYGDIKLIREEQMSLNVLLTQLFAAFSLMGNPQWMHEEGTFTAGTPSNRPGLDIEITRGMWGHAQQLEGKNVPSTGFALVDQFVEAMTHVTNFNEITQGAMPQSHTPGYAIQLAQNANLARIRGKSRWFEKAIRRLVYLKTRRMQEFADWFDPRLRGRMDLGEYDLFDPERIREMTFDIKIESRAEMPAGFAGKLAMAGQWIQAGLMDIQSAVKYVGLPLSENYEELLRLKAENDLLTLRLQNIALRQQAGAPALSSEGGGQPPAAPAPTGMIPEGMMAPGMVPL